MTAPNGHKVTPEPSDPTYAIAEAVWTASMDEEDAPWGDLAEEERDYLAEHARMHLTAHLTWLTAQGVRLLPPGAAVVPRNDEEAAAMVLAVKSYRESKRRKGGLLMNDKKLILPPGRAH